MKSGLAMVLRTFSGSLLCATLLASCGIRLPIATHPQDKISVRLHSTGPDQQHDKKEPDLLVWLIADRYHTGMVFPYDWLLDSGYIPPADFQKSKYVTMSWGNTNAYSKEGIDSYWKMMQVLFTPTPSVMELIPSDWNVVEVCSRQRIWRKLVRRDCGPRLAAFLNQCSMTTQDGRPIVVRESSWGKGVQLEGRYHYFIPRVCNVWTAQAIECMGGEINPWFGLTADGLIRQIESPPNNFEKIWDAYPKEH